MKVVLKNPDQFKELITRKGYSQRGLGRAINISEAYATQICNGTRNPSPETAKRILDLLSILFDDIFFTSDDCKSNQSFE